MTEKEMLLQEAKEILISYGIDPLDYTDYEGLTDEFIIGLAENVLKTDSID